MAAQQNCSGSVSSRVDGWVYEPATQMLVSSSLLSNSNDQNAQQYLLSDLTGTTGEHC